eukprot:80112-Prorocentrum_minimum.AAC.2
MYGPAADVWSLGCLAAEVLTGRPPHQSVADADVARAVEEGRPPLAEAEWEWPEEVRLFEDINITKHE